MKMLAEWFWIDRWDGSPAAALPIHARGLYREMLTRAWRLGGWLPKDPAVIQRLVRVTPKEWRAAWPLIACYWQEQGDRLVNTTQLEVMAEAARRKTVAREKAAKAARAKHTPSTPQAAPQAVLKHMPPSPSPIRTTDQSNDHAREANPLLGPGEIQRRVSEGYRLIRWIAAFKGKYPEDVLIEGAHYDGAKRQKVRLGPPWMTEDRTINTVSDLRAEWEGCKAADPAKAQRIEAENAKGAA